jgi:hypothetical protein
MDNGVDEQQAKSCANGMELHLDMTQNKLCSIKWQNDQLPFFTVAGTRRQLKVEVEFLDVCKRLHILL